MKFKCLQKTMSENFTNICKFWIQIPYRYSFIIPIYNTFPFVKKFLLFMNKKKSLVKLLTLSLGKKQVKTHAFDA